MEQEHPITLPVPRSIGVWLPHLPRFGWAELWFRYLMFPAYGACGLVWLIGFTYLFVTAASPIIWVRPFLAWLVFSLVLSATLRWIRGRELRRYARWQVDDINARSAAYRTCYDGLTGPGEISGPTRRRLRARRHFRPPQPGSARGIAPLRHLQP